MPISDLGLGDLPDLDVGDLPTVEEFRVLLETTETVLSQPPTASQTLFSQKISIRVPHDVLIALKARAGALGVPYQTLMNDVLAGAAFESS